MGTWIVEADTPGDGPLMVIQDNPDGTVSFSMSADQADLSVQKIEEIRLKLGAAAAQAINASQADDGTHRGSSGGDDRV